MGSPRKAGNTAALLAPFCEALEQGGAETETVWLYDREIRPCRACRICQRDWTVFGCPQEDDVQDLFDRVLAADLIVPLWEGKAVALLLTCGYRPEKGCDLFETGMRRYCAHSRLRYLGSHAERHLGYDVPFMDEEKTERVRAFAGTLLERI